MMMENITKFFFLFSLFALLSICASNIFSSDKIGENEIVSYQDLIAVFNKEFESYKKEKQIKEDALYSESIFFLADIISNLVTEKNRQKILNEILNRKDEKKSAKTAKGTIQAFLIYYSQQNNKDVVLNILSKKCPSRIGIAPVELFLVSDTKIKDSFFLFIEAYKKSTDEENKRVLAAIIRRSLISNNEDDISLVTNAEKWYIEHMNKLKVNGEYIRNNSLLHHIPLFIIAP